MGITLAIDSFWCSDIIICFRKFIFSLLILAIVKFFLLSFVILYFSFCILSLMSILDILKLLIFYKGRLKFVSVWKCSLSIKRIYRSINPISFWIFLVLICDILFTVLLLETESASINAEGILFFDYWEILDWFLFKYEIFLKLISTIYLRLLNDVRHPPRLKEEARCL